MARRVFEHELQELNDRLKFMGDSISYRIEKVVEALRLGETLLMEEIANSDDEIDRLEHENEKYCIHLIVEQQPMAGDLRFIAASLKILTDMEREADQCEDICNILLKGGYSPGRFEAEEKLISAGECVYSMFTKAMDSFLLKDPEEAEKVCEMDNIVDNYFKEVVKELVELINKDPKVAKKAMDLLFVIKYLERMGDHATNIAERVPYLVNMWKF